MTRSTISAILLGAAAIAAPAAGNPVRVESWGQGAHLYTLTNAHGMIVKVSDWGGLVTAIEVPDAKGRIANVALGFGTLADYQALNRNYAFGSPVGRYANRIAGAAFPLDGHIVRITPNEGPNTLHSGPTPGYNMRPWRAESFDHGRSSGVTLHLVSPAGDQDFPGTLSLTMTYTLTDANELRIDYRATTDAPTALNLTNHSYFNLAGAGEGTVMGQTIQIDADRLAEFDAHKIPTGRLLPVTGSFDLRRPRRIGDGIAADPALVAGHGYDHAFVLADAPRAEPMLAARATDPASGRVMEVLTTEPSLQFYTGNGISGTDRNADGKPLLRNGGFAIETQHLPDSVNHPDFPTTILRPGQVFTSTTIYRFSVAPPSP